MKEWTSVGWALLDKGRPAHTGGWLSTAKLYTTRASAQGAAKLAGLSSNVRVVEVFAKLEVADE